MRATAYARNRETRAFWERAFCAVVACVVVRNGAPPHGMYAQDLAYSAGNAADAAVLEWRKRFEAQAHGLLERAG